MLHKCRLYEDIKSDIVEEGDSAVEEERWSDWVEDGEVDSEKQQVVNSLTDGVSPPTHGLTKWIEKSPENDLARLASCMVEERPESSNETEEEVASQQEWIPPASVLPADVVNTSEGSTRRALCSLPLDKSPEGSMINLCRSFLNSYNNIQ